nr:hypothetical protein Iba_scaffold14328CG0010 [Ipomoea batatas]
MTSEKQKLSQQLPAPFASDAQRKPHGNTTCEHPPHKMLDLSWTYRPVPYSFHQSYCSSFSTHPHQLGRFGACTEPMSEPRAICNFHIPLSISPRSQPMQFGDLHCKSACLDDPISLSFSNSLPKEPCILYQLQVHS